MPLETGVSVGMEVDDGMQEVRKIERKIVSNVFAFIFSLVFRLEDKTPNGWSCCRCGGNGCCLAVENTRNSDLIRFHLGKLYLMPSEWYVFREVG